MSYYFAGDDVLDIKVTNAERKMHRFTVPADIIFFDFTQKIEEFYGLLCWQAQCIMYFQDEDDEKILLESDEDWDLALRAAKIHPKNYLEDDGTHHYFLRVLLEDRSPY